MWCGFLSGCVTLLQLTVATLSVYRTREMRFICHPAPSTSPRPKSSSLHLILVHPDLNFLFSHHIFPTSLVKTPYPHFILTLHQFSPHNISSASSSSSLLVLTLYPDPILLVLTPKPFSLTFLFLEWKFLHLSLLYSPNSSKQHNIRKRRQPQRIDTLLH